ncbi:membrane protein insertion efficiency factor YidD [Gynuella sunshinyii]|uniref:Membrane protein insertion efficiency factor YidD n=1 Tax=Gynuella sunshinyii YC6258 TaxID=1445510 RepID=A0A0C5VSE2_9GAMM|nr:membrane protein insertion efficiency factor YidD [Gynuella sunshinyii]AJQ96233.1 hypothetical protein YC6258_04199 [Gynuella sunshinyii YC6258]
MNALAIALINGYQKYLSPYKGFKCAHAVLYQDMSCSQAIKQIIATEGLLGGYRNIRRRFSDCRKAYEQLSDKSQKRERRKKGHRCNYCDPGIACDVADCLPGKGCHPSDSVCDCSIF